MARGRVQGWIWVVAWLLAAGSAYGQVPTCKLARAEMARVLAAIRFDENAASTCALVRVEMRPPSAPGGVPTSGQGARAATATATVPSIAPLSTPPPAPGTEPSTHYAITASLDPSRHVVTGRQQLTWRNPSALSICTLYLHLDLNAFENAGTRYLSTPAGREMRGGKNQPWGYSRITKLEQDGRAAVWIPVQPDGLFPSDRTLVRVDLPQPVAAGAGTTLDISFVDQLPGTWSGMGHSGSFHLVAHWFPQLVALDLPNPNDRRVATWVAAPLVAGNGVREAATFDVRLTVPEAFGVGASGDRLGETSKQGSDRTHHFFSKDVDDFVWSADARFDAPLVYQYQPPGGSPIRLQVLARADQAAAASEMLDAMIEGLRYDASRLPPLALPSITGVVVPPDAVGEIAVSSRGLFAAQATGGSRDALHRATLHAIGAAYFHNLVDTQDNALSEGGLSEGVARYWSARILSERKQRLRYPLPGVSAIRFAPALDAWSALRVDARWEAPADARSRPARIALALHDLEARIGTPAMDRGLAEVVRRWRGAYPRSAELRASLAGQTRHTDEVMRIFAMHIDDDRGVDDRIVSLRSEELLPQPGSVEFRGQRIELTQAQIDRAVAYRRERWRREHPQATSGPFAFRSMAIVQRRGALPPQTIEIRFADGSTQSARLREDAVGQQLQWLSRSPAVAVQIDPQRRVMLDRNKFDDSRTLTGTLAPARRWGGDALAAMQMLAALLAGL